MEIIKALYIRLYNDIQKWSYANNVVNQAGGFTIGYSTWHFISSLIVLISPLFIIIGNYFKNIGKNIGIEKTGFLFKIIKLLLELLILIGKWLFTILVTFLLLEYMFNNKLLGLKSNIKDNEKKDFIVSKMELKTEKSSEKIIEEDNKEKLIGKIIIKENEYKMDKIINEKEDYQNVISQIL